MDELLVNENYRSDINYEENDKFNQEIDMEYGHEDGYITIAGFSMRPSEILFKLDPISYHATLLDFNASQTEIFKQTVFTEFPTPIAFNFERFERGYENQHQRLLLLRDTWESIIFLLYALVIGEFRYFSFSMDGTTIKPRQLLSDRIDDKLSILEQLVSLSSDRKYSVSFLEYVSGDILDKLRELNRVRNEFSHSSAKTKQQCLELISKYENDVLVILKGIINITNITIMRYAVQEEDVCVFRYEDFRGCSLNRTMASRNIKQEDLSNLYRFLNKKNILASYKENFIYCVSPFLHFKVDPVGNSKLCFYKRKKAEGDTLQLFYEILDGSGETELQEIEINKNDFINSVNELKLLLPDLSSKTGCNSL